MSFSVQSLYNWYRSTIRNPKYRWWLILGSLLYLFSPLDIAPDFIPIVGLIDDAAVMTLLVSEVSQLLIDYVKLRQGEDKAEVADSATSATDSVVDVDAVSVK
ncbi:MAG TPA: YkvA family protein [Leptolyngbyaceae cyanobacterium]